jgi:hypothetical protein
MIRGPIAFDREHRPTQLLRMHRDQIDAIARRAELRSRLDAMGLKSVTDVGLKCIETNFSRAFFLRQPRATTSGIFQIHFE